MVGSGVAGSGADDTDSDMDDDSELTHAKTAASKLHRTRVFQVQWLRAAACGAAPEQAVRSGSTGWGDLAHSVGDQVRVPRGWRAAAVCISGFSLCYGMRGAARRQFTEETKTAGNGKQHINNRAESGNEMQ